MTGLTSPYAGLTNPSYLDPEQLGRINMFGTNNPLWIDHVFAEFVSFRDRVRSQMQVGICGLHLLLLLLLFFVEIDCGCSRTADGCDWNPTFGTHT
jgi:hypothetical protein